MNYIIIISGEFPEFIAVATSDIDPVKNKELTDKKTSTLLLCFKKKTIARITSTQREPFQKTL